MPQSLPASHHSSPADAAFQASARTSCYPTSGVSNHTVEPMTPNVATCQSHTSPVGWIGTYRRRLPFFVAYPPTDDPSPQSHGSAFCRRQGRKEELVIPTCQNFRTRSLGSLGHWAALRQGRDAAALIPDLLSDLKRLGCQVCSPSASILPQRRSTVLCGTVAPSTLPTSPHSAVALRRQHPNRTHHCLDGHFFILY